MDAYRIWVRILLKDVHLENKEREARMQLRCLFSEIDCDDRSWLGRGHDRGLLPVLSVMLTHRVPGLNQSSLGKSRQQQHKQNVSPYWNLHFIA